MKKRLLVTSILFSLAAAGLMASCGNSGGESKADSSQIQLYRITVEGTGFTADGIPAEAAEGETIRFSINVTEEGKIVAEVKAGDKVLTPASSGRYSFKMPAAPIAVKVTLGSVQSITLDTSAAKTAFLVGSTFDSTGLKVLADMGTGTPVEVTRGFTVSAPDLSEEGEKDVTVTYGGASVVYKVRVGSLTRGAATLEIVNEKPTIVIRGTYTSFASAAELTKATSNGAYLFDLQYNANAGGPSWDRNLQNDNIQFEDDGTGAFKFSVDVSSLRAGGGSGIGYTMHFGVPNESGQDIGAAGDWKPEAAYDKEITVGTRKYRLLCVPGSAKGSEFWGNYGLIIIDDSIPMMNVSGMDLVREEDKSYVVITVAYSHVSDLSVDSLTTNILCDVMQLSTWSQADVLTNEKLITAQETDPANNAGTVTIKLNVTDRLDATHPYFFHFDFDPEGAPTDKEHNVQWQSGWEEKSIVDPKGTIKLREYTNPAESWMGGLAILELDPNEYVRPDTADLVQRQDKAVFTLSGNYAGITTNENEDYYLDCMDFSTNTDVTEGGTLVNLTFANPGESSGRFELSFDLTGRLTANEDYYFHVGKLPEGSQYRTNLKAQEGLTRKEITLADGVYSIDIASGYSGDNDGWRNGLAIVRFTPAA